MSRRRAWLLAAVALALLAWQGQRVAHWLPEIERSIAALGPWGPLALIAVILVAGPLLVPDSVFGVASGVSFGLLPGTLCYFAGLYLMCLAVHLVSRRWLGARVMPVLDTRPSLRAVVMAAAQGGTRTVFLVRLIPINQALLSYALGAARVPLRSALIGNAGMLVHVFPTVYFGAAAAHVTRMAGRGQRAWEAEGLLLLLGLAACALLALLVAQRARAALGVGEDGADRRASDTPPDA